MSFQYTPYVWPLVLGTVLSTALAVLAARRRQVRGAVSLAWIMAVIAFWMLCYALQVSSTALTTIVFWSNAAFLSIAFVPLPWLTFALEYSGCGRWITARNIALLAIVPSITQFMVWTNEALGFFRTELTLVTRGPILTIESGWGWWFWVHTAYSYLLIVVGLLLLAWMVARSSALYRRQAITLMTGALVPLLANVVFLFVLTQSFILDPTPFTLLVTGVTFALGLFRFQLLDVVPAARDAVIEGMGDAVLVLDAENRIVDLNPAAQRVLGCSGAEAIGRPAGEILTAYEGLLDRHGGLSEGQAEVDLAAAGYFDMRLSALHDRREQPTGRLIVLRDITDRRRAEQALERWAEQFQVVSEVAHEIAAGHDLDDLLGRVAGLVQSRFGAYQVAIYLADDQGHQTALRAARGEGCEELLDGRWRGGAQAELVEEVLRQGVSRVVSGPETGMVYSNGPSPDTRSEAAMPLCIGQRTIGVLDVCGTAPDIFGETVVAVLQAVADQLAVAIEHARLLEQMASSVREMERTYREQDLVAWRSLTETAGQALGYRYRQQRVETTSFGEITPEVEKTLQQGQPVSAGTGDAVAVPIVLRNQTIGALSLRHQGEHVASETTTLIQEVANRVALTLESARLYQETQRSAARERLIGDISDRMRRAPDVESIVHIAMEELSRALGTPHAFARLGTTLAAQPDREKE